MKKGFVVFIFDVLMLVMIVACASGNVSEKIELFGNPTTGYTWVYSIEDKKIVEIDEDITYLGEGNIVGAPSLFLYEIHPVNPGETTVTFEYKRPWEKDVKADRMEQYEVTVTKNGRVKIRKIRN